MHLLRKLAMLAAIPAAVLGLALPASAAAAQPAATQLFICANGGAGLCMQNNGLSGSVVATDSGNGGLTQQWTKVSEGTTVKGSPPPTGSGYPFNSKSLNDQIATGRSVWQVRSTKSGGSLCLNVNQSQVTLGTCSGSQSLWVQSGSGRMISVGDANFTGSLSFADSLGINGNAVVMVGNGSQDCPGACWSNF